MLGNDPYANLVQRLRAGDPAAEQEVFLHFQKRLIALARQRLGVELRGKADPESAVQSALASFFLRHREGQFELDDWPALWGLLTRIVLYKCGHRREHFHAACRDVRREAGQVEAAADSGRAWEAVAREPSPEAVEVLMRDLSECERLMLTFRLQGYLPAEIAQKTGRTERTVYRLQDRIHDKLEQMLADS